ncbi:MAG: NTP/NDP exchange transporter [Parachlamydiaceae bacterium]
MFKKLLQKVEMHEWFGIAISFIYYFCILTAYYVMRPMRDQLAAEVGTLELPFFFMATLVATLCLTPLFAWLVARFPRHVAMPVVYLFFIVCLAVFIWLFDHPLLLSPETLGLLFFVWVSIFNLFVVSVFWSFMADIWSEGQAMRLFPLIALGGTTGAITGPLITRSLIEIIDPSTLLMISTALLVAAIGCIMTLGKWAQRFGFHRHETGNESAIGGGILDGIKQIVGNAFIRNMAIMMLLNDAIGTIAYVLVTDYSSTTFMNDSIAQTRFAANMDLASNISQIVLQLTITRFLLVRYGPGFVFLTCAATIVISCIGLYASHDPFTPWIGTMPLVSLILILTRALSYGMLQPARESLYTLVTRDLRYKGKNAVDTFMWRAGDVLSLLSINAFRALGVTTSGFGLIWAGLAAISGVVGWKLAVRAESGEFEKSR